MINYILQVLMFQILFLTVYDFFFKKETFFQWNRFYLLITAILAYLIPLLKIERIGNYIQQEYVLPEIILNPQTIFLNEVIINKTTINSFFTLENFYYIGFGLMLVLFLFKISQIIKKINTYKIINKSDYKLVIINKSNKAFSFFNYIFLGEILFKKQHQHILKHELIHVKQRHSIDLLLFEIQKIVFWFNPLTYVFQNRISVLHEFIADAKTITTKDKTSFFESLLNQTFNVEKITFINNYYKQSLLKKRIIMATKNKSKQILKMKYLLILPILLLMFVFSSFNNKSDVIKETAETIKVEKTVTFPIISKLITTKKDTIVPPKPPMPPMPPKPPMLKTVTEVTEVDELIPFSVIEKTPIYPNCENFTTNKDLKKCFSAKITKHISENFNIALAKNLGLTPGKKKINVQFKINKQGNVSDIKTRAPHPKLQEEAIRIIKLLPKFKAGMQRGKPVAVRYNLPIIFNVEGDLIKKKQSENTRLTGTIGQEFGYLRLAKKTLLNNEIAAINFNTKKVFKVISFTLNINGEKTILIKGNKITAAHAKEINSLESEIQLKIQNIKTIKNGEIFDNIEPINIRLK